MAERVTVDWDRSPQYDKNYAKADGRKETCLICGKNVNARTCKWVELVDYGATVKLSGPEELAEHEGGNSIGYFAIGPDCHKKMVKAAKEQGA